MPDTTLQFNGHQFHVTNTCGVPIEHPPKLMTARRFYWAQPGMTEIVGGTSGRPILFDVWVHNNFAQHVNLQAYLVEVDGMVGEHGTVRFEFQGNVIQYRDCTFEGFERSPVPGRKTPTPINDVVGGGAGIGGWFQPGIMKFYQLKHLLA